MYGIMKVEYPGRAGTPGTPTRSLLDSVFDGASAAVDYMSKEGLRLGDTVGYEVVALSHIAM